MATKSTEKQAPFLKYMPMVGAEMAMAASRAWMQSFSEYNREMSRFLAHRLEKDADLQSQIADCKKPVDIVEVCSDFTQNTMKEYAEETQKLQTVAATALSKGIKTVEANLDGKSPSA